MSVIKSVMNPKELSGGLPPVDRVGAICGDLSKWNDMLDFADVPFAIIEEFSKSKADEVIGLEMS